MGVLTPCTRGQSQRGVSTLGGGRNRPFSELGRSTHSGENFLRPLGVPSESKCKWAQTRHAFRLSTLRTKSR